VIAVSVFEGKEVAVFGMARSGLAAARSLTAGGATPICWDDKDANREAAAAQGLTLEDLQQADFSRFAALVLAPGVPLTHPEPHWVVKKAQAAGVEIIGDIELFVRALGPKSRRRARIVAITGTNGKSTTTALIGHTLRRCGLDARIGGNIGSSVLDLPAPGTDTVYVVECSSFQLDLTPSLAPDVSVLLNITPDHLDRHGTMENYAAVKAKIFRGQTKGDRAIIGVDDAYTAQICTDISGNGLAAAGVTIMPISVGKVLGRGVYAIDGVLYDGAAAPTQTITDLRAIPALTGAHNWQNAAAAYAAVARFVADPRKIAEAMASFPGLAHRMEIVAEKDGVRFVNDSKATNAEAAAKALGSYDGIHWILGGVAKAGGIEPLTEYFPRIKAAYLIGEASDAFADTIGEALPVVRAGTLERAVSAAAKRAEEEGGGVVLLSPACASFDQFKDFEARGDAFREAVKRALGGEERGETAGANTGAGSAGDAA